MLCWCLVKEETIYLSLINFLSIGFLSYTTLPLQVRSQALIWIWALQERISFKLIYLDWVGLQRHKLHQIKAWCLSFIIIIYYKAEILYRYYFHLHHFNRARSSLTAIGTIEGLRCYDCKGLFNSSCYMEASTSLSAYKEDCDPGETCVTITESFHSALGTVKRLV